MDYSKRNQEIRADRQSGLTLAEVAKKHGVSKERVRQICLSIERSESMKNDSLWNRLLVAAIAIGGYDESQIVRAYNCIKRTAFSLHMPFEQVPREQWSEIRNCGKKTLKLLCEAFPE